MIYHCFLQLPAGQPGWEVYILASKRNRLLEPSRASRD